MTLLYREANAQTLYPGTQDSKPFRLLNLLREREGWLSGKDLAARLGVSLGEVQKCLQSLRNRGYVIFGKPRRGYRLAATPDKLYPEEILHRLGSRRFRGPVYYLEITASTNDLAKTLGAEGAPEGTLVVAEAQTAGRGRLGRNWLSPPGVGLYVSLLLRPPLPCRDLPPLTLTAAVAVVRALTRITGVTPGIKWPNDLLLSGKKIGGILTELKTDGDRPYVVVGLGLNVNTREFPPELEGRATSLARELKRPLPRVPLLKAWLEEFDNLYHEFLDQKVEGILKEWSQHSITLGAWVRIRQGESYLEGRALEVAPNGALGVETAPGRVEWVICGEISPP
jgi:BirA family biotin operon repressor/biotin-[acetyl-CoA-carboxylase] ligase